MATGNPVIATSALGLIPVVTGIKGNIASQLASSSIMSETNRAGRSIGSRLGSSITSALKTGLKLGGVVGGALAGLTLTGGINRALGIEDARAMMGGLGHDTESVEKIMANALASVEGTAFGLDSAATAAAGAVAAGIKPGQQLEQTMKTVANVAAGARAPMEEIGSIFNTVAAVGTAYTGDINMIAQRGIPIWNSLAETLGVSQAEVKKMASAGQIDFATFEKAARDAAGGVATAMGDTTRGSIANMLTSFSKLGADVVTRFMPMVKAGAQGIQATVQALTKKFGPVLDSVFGSFTPSATAGIAGFFDGLVAKIDTIDPQVLISFFEHVKGFVSGIDFSSASGFFDSLSGGTGAGLSTLGSSLQRIAAASPKILASSLEILGSAMEFLGEHSDAVVRMLPLLIAGFAAYRVTAQGVTAAVTAQNAADLATLPVQIARNVTSYAAAVARHRATAAEIQLTAATNANTVTTARATIAERARTIATKAGALASKAAAAATRLLGTAIKVALGPVGWIIAGVTLLGTALWAFFTKTEVGRQMWARIWGAIKDAAAAVLNWAQSTLLPMLQAAWNGIAAGALWLWNSAIVPAWNGIRSAISAVGGWITGTLVPWLQGAWGAIGAAAMWLWQSVLQPAWTGIRIAVAIAVAVVMTVIQGLVALWRNVLAPAVMWLWRTIIQPAWNGIRVAIGAVVAWFQNVAWPMVQRVIAWLGQEFHLFRLGLQIIWQAVRTQIINPVILWFQGTAWPIIQRVLGYIRTGFNVLRDALAVVWAGIRNVISPVVSWFASTVWPRLSGVIDKIKAGFNVMKTAVGKAWNALVDLAKKPVNFIINRVYNDGIRANFNKLRKVIPGLPQLARWNGLARGGILPGFSRMRDGDDQLVPMRRGEGVLVSEALRSAQDKAAFLAVNALGRKGVGFSDVLAGRGFAGGGILDFVGDTAEWMKDKAGKAWDFIADPVGAFKGMVGKALDAIPGAGLFRDVATGVGKAILKGITDKITGITQAAASSMGGAAAPVGPLPAGASRSLGYASQVARSFGLTMTSGYRPGARTSTGSLSMHGLGRARDYSNSTGPTPQMMGFFNAMWPLKPTELLYSPAGGRQWRRGGRMANTSGTVRRIHFNHVHVAFADGGIVDANGNGWPMLFDQGGEVPPGLSLVANKTGRPEKILPPRESEALTRLAEGSGGQHFYYSPQQVDLSAEVEHRTRREFEAMMHEARRVVGA